MCTVDGDELVTVSLVAVVVCDVAVRDKMQLNSV